MLLPDYMFMEKKMASIIKNKRIKLKLTQTEVAKRANISVSTFGNIERGEGKISLNMLYVLSGILDIHPGELLMC